MYRAIDLPLSLTDADLVGPVHGILGSTSAVLTDWRISPLASGRGEITGGVYRARDTGRTKAAPCLGSSSSKSSATQGDTTIPGPITTGSASPSVVMFRETL